MKIERFKATFVLATIVLMVGCINQAKAGAPSELAQIGDFSISLTDIKREENTTTLHFAITKVSDSDSGNQSLQVTLMDDHRNEYSGNLDIRLKGVPIVVLNALSKGFTYVDMVSISMPKIAPIETIKLGDIKEISFKKVKFGKPQFMKNFGHLAITKGQSVGVGKWLSFTMEQILPAPGHWELPVTIENREYNSLPARVKVGVQHGNGTISWSHDESITVPALSKISVKVAIPIPSWVEVGPPQPKVLLNVYSDRSRDKGETVLRIFPMTLGDLPPLVGQGPEEIEDVFLQAYKRNGGQDIMGNPLDLPYWFAGGDKPKDKNDVLIQEFPAVSDFGKSATIWDRQDSTKGAFVMHGELWEKYQSLGGPYHKLESGILLGRPTSDEISIISSFKTKGNYHYFKSGMMIRILSGRLKGQTFLLYGKIYEKFKNKGFTEGTLGFPTNNRKIVSSGATGFDTEGWIQNFEGGDIYYLTSGKYKGYAFETYGDLNKFYSKIQNVSSWLGFPITDQYPSPTGYDTVNCEGGYITSADGVDWKHFPYESGEIVFVLARDGNNEIYTMDSKGQNQINLTKNPANDFDPAWSPDGTKIAFISDRDGTPQIYIMNSDGSNVTSINGTARARTLTWFPDGSKIAFTISGSRAAEAIFVVDVNGKHLTKLASHTGFPGYGPAVSPNGEKIAYMAGTMSGSNLRIANLSGETLKEFRRLEYGSNPSWSPNGKYIVYFYDGTHKQIHILNVNTGEIKTQNFTGSDPSWLPNGRGVIFSRGNNIALAYIDSKISRKISEGKDPSWWESKKISNKNGEKSTSLTL